MSFTYSLNHVVACIQILDTRTSALRQISNLRQACVLRLHVDVQLPQYIGNEFLDVLMATVGEGDARTLSIGRQRRGGNDPFRVDDDDLIVQLRELYECHERPA